MFQNELLSYDDGYCQSEGREDARVHPVMQLTSSQVFKDNRAGPLWETALLPAGGAPSSQPQETRHVQQPTD